MKYVVTVRAAAEADLRAAHAWYDERRPGLGDEFLLEVAEVFRRLEESAERPPVYYRGFRRMIARRFPYKIFYRVDAQNVIVFRVLHAAQDHTRHLKPTS